MLTERDLAGLFGRVILTQFSDRTIADMSALELREALQGIPGAATLTVSYNIDNGNQVIHCGDKSVEVGPMASYDEIRAALTNPFVPTANTQVSVANPADRLKDKLARVGGLANKLTAKIESKADALLAKGDALDAKTDETFAKHEAVAETVDGQLNDLDHALNQLSNGSPEPLEH